MRLWTRAARDIAGEWREAADPFAHFVWQHFVNSEDVYGCHLWWKNKDGVEQDSATLPWPSERSRKKLTIEIIRRHIAFPAMGSIIGLHTTSPDNESRWFAFDFDAHGEGDLSELARVNLAAVMIIRDRLISLDGRLAQVTQRLVTLELEINETRVRFTETIRDLKLAEPLPPL